MNIITRTILILLIYSTANAAAEVGQPQEPVFYSGSSDASAAVAVGDDMFVVADDENNILRIYKAGCGSGPLYSYDLTDFLNINPKHPEADIEAATIIEDRICWITSHGRNKDGKIRPNRYRFFATSVKTEDKKIIISPLGKP